MRVALSGRAACRTAAPMLHHSAPYKSLHHILPTACFYIGNAGQTMHPG